VDDTSHKNNATVEFEFLQGDKQVFSSKQTSAELDQNGEQLTIQKIMPAGALQPGKYKLNIKVTDNLANQSLLRCGAGPCSADFTVLPAEAQQNGAPAAASAPGAAAKSGR